MKKRDIFIAVAGMLALTACSDDYFNRDVEHDYSDYIGYSINVAGSDQFQSRSSSSSRQTRQLTIDPTGASIGGRQLYLLTEVSSDFPEVSRTAETESRGTEIKDGELEDLRVSAVVFDGEWGAADFDPQPYMNNELVEVNSSWNTGRFWPRENDSIRFYAHAPANVLTTAPNNIGGIPFPEGANEPSFAYTVPQKVTDQKDLLVASAQYEGDYCQTAHLEFGHALTAVEIKISEEVEGFTLTGLTISGLKDQGTYTYKWAKEHVDANTGNNGDSNAATSTHDAGSWTGQTGSATYTVFPRPAIDGETQVGELQLDGSGADITADGMLLLLMPQQLPETAMIEVEGTDFSGENVHLQAFIGGADSQGNPRQWVAGKRVVYTLTFDSYRIEYHLTVTPTIAEDESVNVNNSGHYLSPYHGEIGRGFTVECYKQTVSAGGTIDEGPVPVDWEIDSETQPWWVDHITMSGKGSGSGDTPFTASGTYSVLPNLTSSTSHNELKGRAHLGTEDNPYDLSTLGGSELMTTANCYMVTAPGWYTFPLVYGNAIKDGAPNPESFMGDTSGENESTSSNGDGNALKYFKTTPLYDDNGNKIKDVTFEYHTLGRFWGRGKDDKIHNPWMVKGKNEKRADDGVEPTKSKLLQWQDEPCLLSNVKLNDNEDYVVFYVNPKTINEGNALIAIRDSIGHSGNIVWSWHIWVTDQINRRSGNGAVDFSTPTPVTNRMVTANYNSGATNASGLGVTVENLFHLMQSPIGGCDADTKTYTEALAEIRFKIMENGTEVLPNKAERIYLITDNAQLKVGVQGGQIEMLDNAPYYQFGRKDPMLPGWTNANPDGKESLDISSKPFFKENRTKGFYGTSAQGADCANCDFEVFEGDLSGDGINHHVSLIGNPMAYFCGQESDTEVNNHDLYKDDVRYEPYTNDKKNLYINQWNAKSNKLPVFSFYGLGADDFYNELKETIAQGVIKTVYDPSPRGYEIPRIDAFAGTTFNGMNFQNWYPSDVLSDHVNVANVWRAGSESFEGVNFYTLPMPSLGTRTGDTFYIPALGHRNNKGDIAAYNSYGSAFTASPMCAQWYDSNGGMGEKLLYQAARFCYTGAGWMRPVSSSDLDLAFPVMPAKTGCNPSVTKISGNTHDWSGDKSDIDVGF